MELRGRPVWAGKCIHCNSRLSVGLDGELIDNATLEHIQPRNHGGTDRLDNLAIACARCNHQKGYRLDNRPADDPKLQEVVGALRRKRKRRWRDPDGAAS